MPGHSEPATILRGLLEPATNYLQKPLSPDDLAATIRRTLTSPHPPATVTIICDDPGFRHFLRRILTGAGDHVFEAHP